MAGPVQIPGVTYLGGFSFMPEPSRTGTLVLDDDALTLDRIIHETLKGNFDPPMELCRTRAVASIEVTSEQVARSKVGAAVLFGVLGAMTAKAASDRATLLLTLKSGETGYLTVDRQSTASVLGTLHPWLREHGIAVGSTGSVDSSSLADELAKLAEIHRSGALTDDEFTAAKAKLLE
jgi:hypothetical protein